MILTTPDQISAFRLLSVRAQLKMEKVGLKSSGGAIRPRIAVEFGLSPRASYDAYVDAINKKLDELKEKIHGQSSEGAKQA